jgi:hypothetical protein
VGVNGGLATTRNPCLAGQLRWAARSSGGTVGQPPVQLYLNTANPGELRFLIGTWPTAWATPYGLCDSGNTTACSWEYGWERARDSVNDVFTPAAEAAGIDADPGHYTWWLDVETENTWQSGSRAALARNRATLEGAVAYVQARGGTAGIYAAPSQWRRIVGTVPAGSDLYRLDSWLAGGSSPADATGNCDRPPLGGGGRVVLTQYVDGGLDRNVSCG